MVTAAVVWAVVRRPGLWRAALRLAPARWWLRHPYLPVPEAGYLQFRAITHTGTTDGIAPADLVQYLRWSRNYLRGR